MVHGLGVTDPAPALTIALPAAAPVSLRPRPSTLAVIVATGAALWFVSEARLTTLLSTAVPTLFMALAVAVHRAPAAPASTVTLDAESITVETLTHRACAPLSQLRKVTESPEALTLTYGGTTLTIPLSALNGDPKLLLDRLPETVLREVAPPAAAPSHGKTLALWLALVALFAFAYFALARSR